MKMPAAVGSSKSLIFPKISFISVCCQKVPLRDLVSLVIENPYPAFNFPGIITLHEHLSDRNCVWDPLDEATFFIQSYHTIRSDVYNMM